MKNVLEELWYTDICSIIKEEGQSQEIKELLGYIADHRTNLQESFSEKQKEIFGKLDDCYDELSGINDKQIFISAFCLGARIAIEVLSAEIK
jgi:hypothetical protein